MTATAPESSAAAIEFAPAPAPLSTTVVAAVETFALKNPLPLYTSDAPKLTLVSAVGLTDVNTPEDNEALAIATQNHEFVNALYVYNPRNFDKKREAQKWWLSKSLENFSTSSG